ncbi:hypothetical protein [Hymenobacter siberiensis]|jgi:Arc/MetJ family transcription regulator|uniref:hypothetical protein n=1 Tax=Hymenobacter siberiensis TaxID=2848396 RepID=UPI001C1DED4D|nr:hypothetical protein [Hymenobacter siberiensis]MBU6121413.1 hypothetical protein [Hymenobacter siberiensis]
MAQAKYAARFENFFENLRLNRDQFADMAAFTLQALKQAGGKYSAVADALEVALTDYRATHAGQLSGEGPASTSTLAQALEDFKAYVKRMERKVINPTYEAGSPDLLAIFPKGRSALTKSSQTKVEDAFTAFLDALDARPTVFTSPQCTEGRKVLAVLSASLSRADGMAKTAGTQRIDLHDGREAVCLALFNVYLTLLLEYAAKPERAAPFFDFSNAGRQSSGPKTPKPAK